MAPNFWESRAVIADDHENIRKLIALLESQHTLSILCKAVEKPVSAPQLMDELQVPRTTIYRCIKELVDAGLLVKVRSQRTSNGHWFDEYRSAVDELRFHIKGSGVVMELVAVKDMPSRLLKLWGYLERK